MNRQKPEQIVQLLHKADEALGQGKSIDDICREHGISPATYHRWKQKYGGLSIQDAKGRVDLAAGPAPFNHSTKIALLRVRHGGGKK